LLDYDDVLAKQRQIIYDRRDSIMLAGDITELVHSFFHETGEFLAKKAASSSKGEGLISGEALKKLVEPAFVPEGEFPSKAYEEATVEEGGDDLGEFLYARYLEKRVDWDEEQADKIERQVSLTIIDRNWTKHIDTMSHLREGIGLRSYAHTNPLQDYVNEGYSLFREMNSNISVDCVYNFMNVRIVKPQPQPAAPQGETAAANASGNVSEATATELEEKPVAKEDLQAEPAKGEQPAPQEASAPKAE
jgi:preprotein translocase subunit SecA